MSQYIQWAHHILYYTTFPALLQVVHHNYFFSLSLSLSLF